MIDPMVLLAFVPASLALNLTPGADMMFCLGQGLRSGPRAAVAASAGISTGVVVHAGVAGLGLGAAVAAAPWAFDAIRWVGVGYLLWLAVAALRQGTATRALRVPATHAFRNGLIVNLANPKVILFMLAFVPQFVDPAAGPILGQFLIFGGILALGGLAINAAAGLFAGGAGRRLSGSAPLRRALGWVSGTIFAALALRLAVMEKG